ncbi:MAG: pyridoxamine 5'-phosphate oxidase family protein, partial [Candidatus Omnitrophica bacterium]|nr:pyridoxamine 5'-phosphate oxidase family protein [Candidatus Omnitrophota bacterium]
MLTPKIIRFLRSRKFISIATCGTDNIPLAAPKLLLRVEPETIYLIDFVMGRIWKNLSINPRVSLSVMDYDELTGYQINGSVEIINEGKLYDELLAELQKKEISLTAERVIDGS